MSFLLATASLGACSSSDSSASPVTGDLADGGTDTTFVAAPVAAGEGNAAPETTTPPPPRPDVLADPAGSGRPWSTTVDGLLTFRGNPTRTFYGVDPVPGYPEIEWREDLLEPFPTGDIVKGSVTVDPDGYPLVYAGSRDNHYRVLSIDGPDRAEELWKLSADAVSPTLWNNDWDGSGLVLDDYLLEGGENSQFHLVKLHRGYDAHGRVTVGPKLVFNTPSWDDRVIADLAGNRAREMSIESSVAVSGNTVYWVNSGGLVMGWDLGSLVAGTGQPRQTFRFWTGDDSDATIAIDDEGFLYVSSEYERGNARAREVGQLMKLDPSRPDDPLVWSIHDHDTIPAGIWSSPAIHRDVVISSTNGGKLFALDRNTGAERWSIKLNGPTWQSPVVVDDVLVYGDCRGVLRGYDVSDTSATPTQLWSVELGGCIESTPAVWKGRIFVGTRGGGFYSLASRP